MDLDTSLTTYVHYYDIILSIFTALKILSAQIHPHSHPATTPGNHSSFYCLFSFAFYRISYNLIYTEYSLFIWASFT